MHLWQQLAISFTLNPNYGYCHHAISSCCSGQWQARLAAVVEDAAMHHFAGQCACHSLCVVTPLAPEGSYNMFQMQ